MSTVAVSVAGEQTYSGPSCGKGTVILVNEASGRTGAAGLSYHRGYTPASGDTGTLGVRADVVAVSSGPGGFEMQGTYSC